MSELCWTAVALQLIGRVCVLSVVYVCVYYMFYIDLLKWFIHNHCT